MVAFRKSHELPSAKEVLDLMLKFSIPRDSYVYSVILSLCGETKDFQSGMIIVDQLHKESFEVFLTLFNILRL